jgi:hypothetical protein
MVLNATFKKKLDFGDRRDRNRMVVGFIITYASSTYHH